MPETLPADPQPGYNYDPYLGEDGEDFFIGKIFARWSGPQGFCSTAREWHIMWAGINAGFRAKILGDVPKCPPLWVDEAAYFETAAMIANVAKCNIPGVVGTLGGVAAWLASPQILALVGKLAGIA
jgi:hypothetical protein